ncbi:uncharacterized protein LOC126905796 isoform X2 [Daktulosphaira vitifoliae]|nr:uncharacterized protein LOC126905796 isoform X2 [Daktulosphaira vitifoliae]
MQEIVVYKRNAIILKANIQKLESKKKSFLECIKQCEILLVAIKELQHYEPMITGEIQKLQNSITEVKKEIYSLESDKKIENTTVMKQNSKLVNTIKTLLAETYDSYFEMLVKKENQLEELKIKCGTIQSTFESEEEKLRKNYERQIDELKVKNAQLKELVSIHSRGAMKGVKRLTL